MPEDAPPGLELRPARAEDAELLFAWRNDPETRAASRRTEPVAADEHDGWLVAVLGDDSRHLLVAEFGGTPVGQVRFDPVDEARWEISVALAPERRGEGLGAPLIETGSRWLWKNTTAAVSEAEVREKNRASLSAFERAGYRRAEESGEPGFVRLRAERP